MASSIALIAGLGNPGPEYELTRHNVGFWLVDELARRHGGVFRREPKFHGELCRVTITGHDVRLLKPLTFMNRSGQSVAATARFFKFPAASILVVHDDLDLPVGSVRLKREGGHGGHNGLRDIIGVLGTRDFPRVRLGVGHPGHKERVTGHVLGRPPREEEESLRAAVARAADAVPDLLDGQFEKAMQRLHSRK
jgi:PTH1 family peptidyl-tRNA hydrolase